MYFLGVKVPMTHQFSRKQQHGDLMPIARLRRAIRIHIENIDGKRAGFRQRGERSLHLLAQAAARPRIQLET
jgi:hypothetical protein